MDDCIFCKIGKENSEKKIYENDSFFSIYDVNPLVEGHSLVISKKHFKTILDVQNSLGSELVDCIKKTVLELVKDYDSEGFNILNNFNEVAGQLVPHVHFHILPRKKDQNAELTFIDKSTRKKIKMAKEKK
jgi:histidine triad (HIT) family protein|tara:strand:+ start:444 stop:836 length:393 start_codon:yes stop_codon:yes gene_type:complete